MPEELAIDDPKAPERTDPALQIRKRRWRLPLQIVAVTAAVVFTGGAVIWHTTAKNTASEALANAVSRIEAHVQLIDSASAKRSETIEEVKTQVTAAAGKVLDEAILTAVSAQVDASSVAVKNADGVVVDVRKTIRNTAAASELFAWDVAAITGAVTSIDTATTSKKLVDSDQMLAAASASVAAGVTAWEVEQARLAAEKVAAERAAVEAAALKRASMTKLELSQEVFARFGFGNVQYNSPLGASHYAATDVTKQIIYMHLGNIPYDRVASVAIHEYIHVLQGREFGTYNQVVAHYGGVRGMEVNADQRARALGATWGNYT